MTDIAEPTAVRWPVAFSSAIHYGTWEIEGVTSVFCKTYDEAESALAQRCIPVLADPECASKEYFKPDVLVDAIIAKRNLGTRICDAPLVIGIGPGFTAGEDCHCVIETKRGHTLGRCIYSGSAIPNTGIPGNVGGYSWERVMRSPCPGVFHTVRSIGDTADEGETVAEINGQPVKSLIHGIIRGLLPDGTHVPCAGFKCGDVDARCVRDNCFTISDKALSVAGGVLEAVCHWRAENGL